MLMIAGIQMALVYVDGLPSRIIDYIFVDAWDIENSDHLQVAFWGSRFLQHQSGDLDHLTQVSKRLSTLDQVIHADLIHYIVRVSRCYTSPPPAKSMYDDLFKFFTNQGADIERRDSFRKETALLVVAEVDHVITLDVMPVLLRFGADYSAVDYKGRGPLHLALKPSRFYTKNLHSRTLRKKLVHLLRAGCSIHAVDNYSRTPTDVARKWRRTKAWKAALQEVGKLECATLDCQCEINVRLSPCLHFHYSVLALAVPAAIDAKLTIAKDRTSRV